MKHPFYTPLAESISPGLGSAGRHESPGHHESRLPPWINKRRDGPQMEAAEVGLKAERHEIAHAQVQH